MPDSSIATSGQELFLRKASLLVANADGDGWDLSEMQFRFRVEQATTQTPNTLEVRIFNLGRDTMLQIQEEGLQVELKAGYQNDPYGVIFTGLITQFRMGKEEGIDTYLDIIAQDADLPYNFAVVNDTLKAGWSQIDILKGINKTLQGRGASIDGVSSSISTTRMPRGKVMFGPARDYLRRISQSANCSWHMQDSKVQILNPNEVTSTTKLILTPTSGLLDQPELTIDGVNFKVLLNPNLAAGQAVQIDASLINSTSIVSLGGQVDNVPNQLPSLSIDGEYKVYYVTHVGDTRGNDWYTECYSITPKGSLPQGTGVSQTGNSSRFNQVPAASVALQ